MPDRRITDGDWQSDESVTELRQVAEDAGTVEGGRIDVDALDLVRILDEVQRRREEDVADRLLEWSKTPEAGRAMWQAWIAALRSQFREVNRHKTKWEILEPSDQVLDGLIAQGFTSIALAAIDEVTGDG